MVPIYRISWFESKRHRISHTSMYFNRLKDTQWVYDRCWGKQVVKIEVIQVTEGSNEHNCAIKCSKIAIDKEKCHCYLKHNTVCERDFICKDCGLCLKYKGYEESTLNCGLCKKAEEEHKLAVWCKQQNEDYKNNTGEMVNPILRKHWEKFLEEYVVNPDDPYDDWVIKKD